MWLNDLKARFSKSDEHRIEDMPAEPVVEQVEEEPEAQVEQLFEPSQVKVPEAWKDAGLAEAIFEAHMAGDMALKEFDKVAEVQGGRSFTCICGLIFMHEEPYNEHRFYSHNTMNHDTEINKLNADRREVMQRRGWSNR